MAEEIGLLEIRSAKCLQFRRLQSSLPDRNWGCPVFGSCRFLALSVHFQIPPSLGKICLLWVFDFKFMNTQCFINIWKSARCDSLLIANPRLDFGRNCATRFSFASSRSSSLINSARLMWFNFTLAQQQFLQFPAHLINMQPWCWILIGNVEGSLRSIDEHSIFELLLLLSCSSINAKWSLFRHSTDEKGAFAGAFSSWPRFDPSLCQHGA